MDSRSELLAYMGTAVVTTIVLFGAQIWYASYLDTHVVNVYPQDAPANAKVAAVRAQEAAKLASGKSPIAQAKAALAQRGRNGFPSIAPKPSEDLSAMGGWMHQPGFKPYTPRAAAQPAQPVEGAVADPGAAQPGAAEPGATAPDAAEQGAAEPTTAAEPTAAPAKPAAQQGKRAAPAKKAAVAPAAAPAPVPAAGH